MSLERLLLFGMQLSTEVFRYIIMCLQNISLLYVCNKAPQVVRAKFVMFLAYRVTPAMRPQTQR
jgi:hypothetical protein